MIPPSMLHCSSTLKSEDEVLSKKHSSENWKSLPDTGQEEAKG